ncbi:MAG: glycosyltransferase family 39 protein [Candidatus Bathyarchaeia archaeon]
MGRTRFANGAEESFSRIINFIRSNPLIFMVYFIIFGIGLFFRLFVWWNYGTLQWDEASHSIGGILFYRFFVDNMLNPLDYLARYPAMTGSFWFYPYGYALLAGISYLFFSFSEHVARLPSLIFSFLVIHASICIAREIEHEHKVSFFSAFFAAVSPIIIVVGSGAMVDVPLTVLITYSLLFWVKGLKNREDKDFLKAGILGGFAGLMKPIGIFVLIFMLVFAVLLFAFLKDQLFFSKGFWKGILSGLGCFSTWWGSAFMVNYLVNGWIGEAAIKGVMYWFDFKGIFGGYVPPWYSPPWYKIEAWGYYPHELLFTTGLLPFILVFVGFFSRLKKMKLVDVLLILFTLGFYVLQTFASNKNPRYIMPILPILYAYAGVGLNFVFMSLVEEQKPLDLVGLKWLKRIVALAIVAIAMVNAFLPLQQALAVRYTPGMPYGLNFPVKECLQIIINDGEAGLLLVEGQDNLFNLPVVTFYLASLDKNGLYGCHPVPSDPGEILNLTSGGKKVRYILIQDLDSSVGKYVHDHPEIFIFLGKVEGSHMDVYIYKVKG